MKQILENFTNHGLRFAELGLKSMAREECFLPNFYLFYLLLQIPNSNVLQIICQIRHIIDINGLISSFYFIH